MCDDHGLASSGPGPLAWGRSSLWLGLPALLAVGAAAFGSGSSADLVHWTGRVAGPLLALAGWSMAGFLGAASDGVAARLTGVAHIVAGAALASGTVPGSPEGTAALGVATFVLGAACLRHPLFGPAWGGSGMVVGIALAALGPAGVPSWILVSTWLAWNVAAGERTAGAVRRLRRGYAGWPEPALV